MPEFDPEDDDQRRLSDAVDRLIEDGTTIGLHVQQAVLASMPAGPTLLDVHDPSEIRTPLVAVVRFGVGPLAYSDRVQHPEKVQDRKMAIPLEADVNRDVADRRMDALLGELGDDDEPS